MISDEPSDEPQRRVAVIGAGVAGLTAAYRLGRAGVAADVYERWPGLGGQAATLDVGGGLRLERYYHYLFTSDRDIIELFGELGLGDELADHASDNAIATDGRVWPFNGPLDLLRFRPIPLFTRIRMGAALVRMQLGNRGLAEYERVTARDWIRRHMGPAAWDGVWGPLMRGKFGERADEISMAWIWDKAVRRRNIREGEARRERFLHPRHGFEPLFTELERRIAAAGGRVMIDHPAARIGPGVAGGFLIEGAAPGSFRRGLDPADYEVTETRSYDAVVCAVPNDVFERLLVPELQDALGADYRHRLEAIEYFTALNLLVELDRPLTDHFWVNVADRRAAFVGVIEHSNFVGVENTAGRRFTHVTNYLPAGHELLSLGPDELLERYEPGLRLVNPSFDRSWVEQRWLFREPAGQPIVRVGYPELIPPRATPIPGLWLVNTTQVYPEDRGTNYAVRDGNAVAREVLDHLAHPR